MAIRYLFNEWAGQLLGHDRVKSSPSHSPVNLIGIVSGPHGSLESYSLLTSRIVPSAAIGPPLLHIIFGPAPD